MRRYQHIKANLYLIVIFIQHLLFLVWNLQILTPFQTGIPYSLSTINICEYSTLSNLDPKKSVGADKIGPIKSCSAILFKPLYHLYSMSLRYTTIAHSWKVRKIIPIFKSGNRNSVKCYQPISLLNNASKVLEHLIYNKIILKITDSISNAQFGFLRNRSALQQLLLFTKELFSSASQIDTVYFDIHKAFDSVSHNLLLLNYGRAESLGNSSNRTCPIDTNL